MASFRTRTAYDETIAGNDGRPALVEYVDILSDDGETVIATFQNTQNGASTATTAYKVYRATLTQSGTDAPVATVLENTFGAELVWTRVEAGLYRATLAGAFPSNRTVVLHNTPPASFGLVCSAGRGSDNVVDVLVAAINIDFGEETFAWQGQDDILGLNFYIEILAYY